MAVAPIEPAPTPEERAALADEIVVGLVDVAASQAQIDDLAPEQSSPAQVAGALEAARELEIIVDGMRTRGEAMAEVITAKEAGVQALQVRVAALRISRDLAVLALVNGGIVADRLDNKVRAGIGLGPIERLADGQLRGG